MPRILACKADNALVAAANKAPPFGGAFTLFNTGSPSINADVDRVKAEQLGLPTSVASSALQTYVGSHYLNDFNCLGRTYQVIAQADVQFR